MSRFLIGQIALVTGGGRGIGRAISLKLAQSGAHVVVNYQSNHEAANLVLNEINLQGGSAELLPFDVSNPLQVRAAIEGIRERHGKLSILINNAGVYRDKLLIKTTDEDWNHIISVNLTGAFYCAREAAKIMMRQRYGRIVSISSVIGESGNAGQSAYSAAKAGLIGLTKSMASELASRNITVNAIAPGFIITDMTSNLDPTIKQSNLESIPLGRFGEAEEVAALVDFLVGPYSGYTTGQVLGINGGMYC